MKIKTPSVLLSCTALLLLGACSVQENPNGTVSIQPKTLDQIVSSLDNNSSASSQQTDQQLIQVTAQRMTADRQNGMVGSITDIQNCYLKADTQWALKQCVALDMATKYFSDVMGKSPMFAPLPYFYDDAFSARMNLYAAKAFGTAQAAHDFMQNSPQIVNESLKSQ